MTYRSVNIHVMQYLGLLIRVCIGQYNNIYLALIRVRSRPIIYFLTFLLLVRFAWARARLTSRYKLEIFSGSFIFFVTPQRFNDHIVLSVPVLFDRVIYIRFRKLVINDVTIIFCLCCNLLKCIMWYTLLNNYHVTIPN